jgi:hypothetical protein
VEVNAMTLRDEGKWLHKKAKKGARAYPVGTIAFYGPDDRRATKVAAAVIEHEGEAASELRRWTTDAGDPRAGVPAEITAFLKSHAVRSVAMVDRIIGCPHEEGVDYPEGGECPACPFWAGRDRWTGQRTD